MFEYVCLIEMQITHENHHLPAHSVYCHILWVSKVSTFHIFWVWEVSTLCWRFGLSSDGISLLSLGEFRWNISIEYGRIVWKFRFCVGSFDNHLTVQLTATFGGMSIYYTARSSIILPLLPSSPVTRRWAALHLSMFEILAITVDHVVSVCAAGLWGFERRWSRWGTEEGRERPMMWSPMTRESDGVGDEWWNLGFKFRGLQ